MNIREYKSNPCRLSALPYWKSKSFKVPSNMLVIHNDEYIEKLISLNIDTKYIDTQYFRLKHELKEFNKDINLDKQFKYCEVDTRSYDDLIKVVNIINECYEDIKVDLDKVMGWTNNKVFNPKLWIFIVDNSVQQPIALGIADQDKNIREGMLEWIQVLPRYRRRGLGKALVTLLLIKFYNNVDFVTVSGKRYNLNIPEKLYRSCGFIGEDVWHILVEK